MKRIGLLFATLIALAACSAAPITIDLMPYLGEQASGSRQVVAPQGQELELMLPDGEGYTASGYDTIGVRPSSVRLDYAMELSQADGQLSGNARLTFYMAAPGDDLWTDANRIGEPVDLDLDLSKLDLSGSLSLNGAQIDALMSGAVTVGARISGSSSGSADVSYTFRELTLKVAFF